MADLHETHQRHAGDVITGNLPSLMGDFAPSAMAKVMGLAANPLIASSFEIKELDNNECEITYIGEQRRTIWSRWEEIGGKWQIADLEERESE